MIPAIVALLVCGGTGCTPSGPRALLQGEELIRKGNYERAVTKLKLAVNLMPNESRAWNYLGVAQHAAGAYGDAIMAYQRAQALDRNLAAARYNLGELYLEQGNPMSAAEELTVFTALEPKSANGWLRLGDALLAVPQLEKAYRAYYNALQLERELPAAYNGAGLIHVQRKAPVDAQRMFLEALKIDPDYAPAILNLAVMAHQTPGQLPSALNRYREYLAKAGEAPNAVEVRAAVRQIESQLNPTPAVAEVIPAGEGRLRERAPVAIQDTNPPARVVVAPATNRATTVKHDDNNAAVVPLKTNVVAATSPAPATNRPAQMVGAASGKPAVPAAHKPTAVAVVATLPDTNNATNKTDVVPARSVAAESDRTGPAAARVVSDARSPGELNRSATSVVETEVVQAAPERAPTQAPAVLEAPLEVITLDESGFSEPGPIATPSQIEPATTSAPPPGQAEPATALAERTSAPETGEGERGFFQRINPVNLFRRDPNPPASSRRASDITPLPGDAEPGSLAGTEAPGEQPAVTTSSEPVREVAQLNLEPETTQLPVETIEVPRYRYGRFAAPRPGDRAAAERLFERGVGAQARRDTAGAATFFNAAAEADPTYFPAHYNLGLAAYKSGQWLKSLSAFETSLALDPTAADARYNFALTLQKANFPLDAAAELERLARAQPDNINAHLLLGNVYAQDLGKPAEARRHYQRVLALDPRHPQATAIRYWLSENP